MISKKRLIGIMLILISAGIGFANGTVEDMERRDYRHNSGRGMMDRDDMVIETVEGKFSLVEGRYPALINNADETYYLLIHFPVNEDQIPVEGAALKLEAIQSPMAPDQLIVVSGEADGVVFDSDWEMNRQGMNGNRQNWGSSSSMDN